MLGKEKAETIAEERAISQAVSSLPSLDQNKQSFRAAFQIQRLKDPGLF